MIKKKKNYLKAKVISTKMHKSIVVKIEKLFKHTKYKKYVRKSIKLHVHDEKNVAKEGDTINILQSRPLSKTKNWILFNIIKS